MILSRERPEPQVVAAATAGIPHRRQIRPQRRRLREFSKGYVELPLARVSLAALQELIGPVLPFEAQADLAGLLLGLILRLLRRQRQGAELIGGRQSAGGHYEEQEGDGGSQARDPRVATTP